MNKNYSDELPVPFVQDPATPSRTINFCVEEQVGREEGRYSYYSVSVPMTRWNYDGIVNALITAQYPNDRMQAVINNYLLATREDGTEVVEEFLEMQEWRSMCKSTAKSVLGIE